MRIVRLLWVVLAIALGPLANAATWIPTGPWGGEVISIAVGQAGTPVYAATEGGLYKSTDAATSWTAVYKTAPARIEQLAIDPNNSAVVYISTFERMYRSADGGGSWSAISTESAEALYVDATAAVYASFPSKGVMKSLDGGTSWEFATSGLPLGVEEITGGPGVLYLASTALFKSVDGGTTWTNVLSTPQSMTAVAVDPRSPDVVYAGAGSMYKSTDAGKTWAKLTSGLPADDYPITIASDPADPNRIYANYLTAGMMESEDAGATWHSIPKLGPFAPRSIAFLPSPSAAVLAGTAQGGVQKSQDDGGTWIDANRGIWLADVTFLETSGSRLYAGAANIGLQGTNEGSSWRPLDPTPTPQALAFDSLDPSILYLATGGAGVRKSTDGGLTWMPAGLGDTVSSIAGDGSTLVASSANEIFRTTDGGATWARAYTSPRFTTITELVADPAAPSNFYANTRPVAMSTDGGATWLPTSADVAATMFVLPGSPSLVYLGADTVYRATSGSGEWTRSAQGLPDNVRIADFAWDEAAQMLYVAFSPPTTTTVVSQIYASADRGATWAPIETQPDNVWVKSLAIFNKTLFAGTSAGLLELQSGSGPVRKRAIHR